MSLFFKKHRPLGRAEIIDISSSPQFQLNRLYEDIAKLDTRMAELRRKTIRTESEDVELEKIAQGLRDLQDKRTLLLRKIESRHQLEQ